jgi:hypothetical protein
MVVTKDKEVFLLDYKTGAHDAAKARIINRQLN